MADFMWVVSFGFSNNQEIVAISVHNLQQQKLLANTYISFLKTDITNAIANTTNILMEILMGLFLVFLLQNYVCNVCLLWLFMNYIITVRCTGYFVNDKQITCSIYSREVYLVSCAIQISIIVHVSILRI